MEARKLTGHFPNFFASHVSLLMGLPWWLSSKEPAYNTGAKGDASLIPGSGTYPAGRCGNPVQYSCLENLMDRGAWYSIVHGVTKSWTRSDLASKSVILLNLRSELNI